MIYQYNSETERMLSSIATVKQNTMNRTSDVHIRVSQEEKEEWLSRAKSHHVGLSDYIRTVINYSDI